MRRSTLAALALLAAGSLFAQSRALNPIVKVDPLAKSATPAECEEGAVPAPTPRVPIAEIPQERELRADMQPPRSNDLRTQFRELHAAIERNDREGFRYMLGVVRTTVAAYPPGGEKSAATEALAVYSDIDRLWEYQFTSPTGAFFDASSQDGAIMKMLSGYRGFEDAMRRNVIADANGNRFYPARESRDFLLREASQRLTRLGVTTSAPVATATPLPQIERPVVRPETREPVLRETQAPAKPATPARSASARATRSSQRVTTGKRTPSKSAGATRVPTRKPAASATTKKPTPAASKPAAAPAKRTEIVEEPPLPPAIVSTPPAAEPSAKSAVSSTATSSGVVETPSTSTASIATSTSATTTETAAPAESSSVQPDEPRPTPAKDAARGRNIVMPLVLILIGVGVLVVLFRASS